MATDDERRKVAERLRELELGVIGTFIPTVELAENILKSIDYGRSGAMTPYGCLADLIDPGDTSQDCRDTVACDREALLALADDVADSAAMATVMDASEGAKMLAEMLHDIARRIRESCGEAVA